ncbi:MAG: hypothetical protein RJA52_672 [Bacteroidota bacterium]
MLFPSFTLNAQERKQLEKERIDLEKKIKETDENLKKIQNQEKSEEQIILELENKITQREDILSVIEKEIFTLSFEIRQLNQQLDYLNESEKKLVDEYSKIMRWAFRNKINNRLLLFILSSESFNQAYQRWQLLKQYDTYRKKQVVMLRQTKEEVIQKKRQLQSLQKEKGALFKAQDNQKNALISEKENKNQLLSKLKSEEKRLMVVILEQEKAKLSLEKTIERLIKAESLLKETKKEKSLESDNFESFKGKLPWPVSNGRVTKNFGKQSHPSFKSLQIENNGIDIITKTNPNIYCVANGKVVSVNYIPGYLYTIIVQHGSFFTVYSNLFSSNVKKGETVAEGQVLGVLDIQKGEVHFEIWKSKIKMNPIDWLNPNLSS